MNYIESKNEPNDKFVMAILKRVIETKLGGLKLLKKPLREEDFIITDGEYGQYGYHSGSAYSNFIDNHTIFMRQGSELLTGRASIEMEAKLVKIYKAIQIKIDFRDKEYSENRVKLKSK